MKQKRLFHWAITVVVTLILLEVVLRVQQNLGPIYDLRFEHATLDGLSDLVNHKPLPKSIRRLSDPSVYGQFSGHEYTLYYDSNGIRINTLRPIHKLDNHGISILFMGDSFMQGYDDSNTIPQHVWADLRANGLTTTVYNAAFFSYSPAIYIPQSKHIIPQVKPAFVVVNIDETDLGDDFIRYKKLIVRDDNGRNIAVNCSPPYYEDMHGCLRIRKQPIFLIRLLQALHHEKVYMPAYTKEYRDDSRSVLSFSRDKDDNAKDKYQKEIAFFRSNLSELADTLIQLMGDKRRILFLYHPHLQHIQPNSDDQYWNTFVSTTLKEVAKAYDLTLYDTSDDLRVAFNGTPQDFYWKKNIHFNFQGLQVYGGLVAKRLLPLIRDVTGLTM